MEDVTVLLLIWIAFWLSISFGMLMGGIVIPIVHDWLQNHNLI